MTTNALYHDGKNAQPYECALSVDENNLNIYVQDASIGLVVWKFEKIAGCAFDSGRLIIKYGPTQQQWLECSGAIAKTIHDRYTGKAVVAEKKEKTSGVFVALTTIGLALIGIALLIYFVVLPWVGEKAASLIPPDVETSIGQTLSEQFTREGGSGSRADSLINAFGKKIDFNTDYKLRLYVLKSDEINAFAVPGGNIFVYSGIIKKMNTYEELVALLGHEGSHVSKRHSLKSICRSAASGFFIAALFGDVSGIAAGVLSQADEFRQLQYSRELETEADLEGLKVMRDNNIDGQGMVRLLQLLEKEAVRTPRLMKYVSTHPETQDRIAAVKANLPEEDAERNDDLEQLFEKLKEEVSR